MEKIKKGLYEHEGKKYITAEKGEWLCVGGYLACLLSAGVLGGVAILNESDTKAAETATENQLETTCHQMLSEVPFEVKTLDGSVYKVVCDEDGSCTKINEGRK